jgi:hypothetical protein
MFNFLKNKENHDENWKKKAKCRRKEIVKLQKRNDEIIMNRDEWKSKAEKYKEEIKRLNEELKKNF